MAKLTADQAKCKTELRTLTPPVFEIMVRLRRMQRGLTYVVALSGLAAASSLAQQPSERGDRWLTNAAPQPGVIAGAGLASNRFANLHLEVLDRRLLASWAPPADGPDAGDLSLQASAAAEDHWPARDWRTRPLQRSGRIWQAELPVEDLDVPIVYYLREVRDHQTNVSPLRVAIPKQLGLEEPTRVFWPLLEGFEEGFESWRILAPPAGPNPARPEPLQISSAAKNGRGALLVSLAAGQTSVRVGTTRVRGWQLLEEGASGLRLWLRTESGWGRVRCSLGSYAFTPAESFVAWPEEFPVTNSWQKLDLNFDRLSGVRWRGVDLFVLEFTASEPTRFLVDELQFLGPWKLDP